MESLSSIHRMKDTPYYNKHNRQFGFETRPTSLYVMDTTAGFKVGIAKDVNTRLKIIQATCPLPITVVYQEEFPSQADALKEEMEMHKVLDHRRMHGEWFEH